MGKCFTLGVILTPKKISGHLVLASAGVTSRPAGALSIACVAGHTRTVLVCLRRIDIYVRRKHFFLSLRGRERACVRRLTCNTCGRKQVKHPQAHAKACLFARNNGRFRSD